LRSVVNDWHQALTNELVCTPPLNGRVDHCESQCLALFTLGRRHVPSRKVEAALCIKMWDMESEETMTSFLRWATRANSTQLQDKCMSLLERIFPHGILTYDWVVVCTNHPEFMHNLRRRSKLIRFKHIYHSEFIRFAMEVEEEQWSVVVIDREGANFDRGKSDLLVFRKEGPS
jgi:hypothetical protein